MGAPPPAASHQSALQTLPRKPAWCSFKSIPRLSPGVGGAWGGSSPTLCDWPTPGRREGVCCTPPNRRPLPGVASVVGAARGIGQMGAGRACEAWAAAPAFLYQRTGVALCEGRQAGLRAGRKGRRRYPRGGGCRQTGWGAGVGERRVKTFKRATSATRVDRLQTSKLNTYTAISERNGTT